VKTGDYCCSGDEEILEKDFSTELVSPSQKCALTLFTEENAFKIIEFALRSEEFNSERRLFNFSTPKTSDSSA